MRRNFWWAWRMYGGKTLREGPFNTENEAYQGGFAKLGSDFEVVELPTKDRNRAKDMIKEIILSKTGNLDLALQRFSNKPVVQRRH